MKKEDCETCGTPQNQEANQDLKKFSDVMLNTVGSIENQLEYEKVCDALYSFSSGGKIQDPILVPVKDEKGNQWNYRFYFGYTRAKYFNSPELTLSSTRVNVVVKDFEWKERSSFNYFTLDELSKKGQAFRFIDEPTSTFGFKMEKNNNVIDLSVFHMKWLFNKEQVKQVNGTIDGTEIDGVIPVSEQFDGYNAQPGEMNLVRLENTYWNINPQIGYGRKIKLVGNDKKGTLSYTPSAYVGLMIGSGYSSYLKEGEYWEYDSKAQKIEVKGGSFSVGHRLEYERKRMGLFLDQKYTASKMTQDFLDGKAKYNLNFSPITFGISVKINK